LRHLETWSIPDEVKKAAHLLSGIDGIIRLETSRDGRIIRTPVIELRAEDKHPSDGYQELQANLSADRINSPLVHSITKKGPVVESEIIVYGQALLKMFGEGPQKNIKGKPTLNIFNDALAKVIIDCYNTLGGTLPLDPLAMVKGWSREISGKI